MRMEKKMNNTIEKLILEDHKPLKKLIKIMKDEKSDYSEKKAAFDEFAPLLMAHAKAEEQALYSRLINEGDLREKGLEGQVEHNLADQMVTDSQKTHDEDVLGAKITVLAEMVEHHIEEEEDEILPEFKKKTDSDVRVEIGEEYLDLKDQIIRDRISLPKKSAKHSDVVHWR